MAASVVNVVLLPLLLLLPGTLTEQYEAVPVDIVVVNSLQDDPAQSFSTTAVEGGILLGAMKRLMHSNSGFKFTYKEDPNFGPFLESVNGVAGSTQDHTYWELLVKTASGETIRPDVGIGCYVPKAHEKIILKFRKW